MLIGRNRIFGSPGHIHIRIPGRYINSFVRLDKDHLIRSAFHLNIRNHISGIRIIDKIVTVASIVAPQPYHIEIQLVVFQNTAVNSLNIQMSHIKASQIIRTAYIESTLVNNEAGTLFALFLFFRFFVLFIRIFRRPLLGGPAAQHIDLFAVDRNHTGGNRQTCVLIGFSLELYRKDGCRITRLTA